MTGDGTLAIKAAGVTKAFPADSSLTEPAPR
jgi:hypothetical protein